ncbi:MAG: sulfotransferase family protein [Terriglobales bacterium]
MSQRSKAPVFVLGCPRSGTTLLYYMLLSSGNFAVYREESHVFNMIVPKFGNLASRKSREKLMKHWLKSVLFEKTRLDARAIETKILEECHSGGDFLRIVMEEVARQQNVERWADTTPEHLLYIPAIKKAFPEALIIHSIRDGRDVALSMDRLHWLPPYPWDKQNSLMVHGLYWEWIVRHGRKDGQRFPADYMEIQFEDLMTHPNETLASIGGFLEHELDYEKIRKVGMGSVGKPNTSFRGEISGGQFSPIGRWKQSFSPQQLEMFEGLVGPFLKELGYSLATSSSRSIGLMAKRMLYQSNFSLKLALKSKTPLGRLLMRTPDLTRSRAENNLTAGSPR